MKDIQLICRAAPVPTLLLAIVPFGILVATLFGEYNGLSLKSGMYFKAFGHIVYAVMYAGCAFVQIEFAKFFFRRNQFIYKKGNNLHIIGRKPLPLNKIDSVAADKFFLGRLSINLINGEKVSIRKIMLAEPPELVKSRIENLIAEV